MNHTIETNEQYALLRLNEPQFAGDVPTEFETFCRGLLREGHSNIIVDMAAVQTVDGAGVNALRKITRQCMNELGLLVLVTKNDDLTDFLEDARIADMTLLPTVEEAIDAVFMHELENDFRSGDDEYDGELGSGRESDY